MSDHAGDRLAPMFAACRAEGRAALIGYLPTGYPDVAGSIAALTALVESGCDLIEVGVPYSDPGMDGPTIARATETALQGGVRVRDTLTAVEAITNAGGRAVVMTYWNPVLRYGVDAFARDLASAGGLGLITPDLIVDEADDWLAASEQHALDRIFLVAPSSTPQRLSETVKATSGFVYAASTMGVTGARNTVSNARRNWWPGCGRSPTSPSGWGWVCARGRRPPRSAPTPTVSSSARRWSPRSRPDCPSFGR